MRTSERVAFLVLVLVLLVYCAGSVARADGALDEIKPPPGCASVLAWGRSLIADESAYLDRWRYDPRDGATMRAAAAEKLGPPWATGHFVQVGDPQSPDGATFTFVPERRTLFALLRDVYRVSDGTPSAAAADEAIDAMVTAARAKNLVLGAGETIPHAVALDLFDDALVVCMRDGTAALPTMDQP